MFVIGIFAAVAVALASAYPGFLHNAPHYTHEVLQNIHNTPYCAYPCIFNDKYPRKFAPECNGKEGKAFGACLCQADAFQYMFDQCVAIRCEKGETEDRKLVRYCLQLLLIL